MLLLKTAAGNEICVVAGFSYWKRYETKSLSIWSCSATSRGCKARVRTKKDTIMFVRNTSGKPLAVYQDYCFHKNGDGKKNQLCTTMLQGNLSSEMEFILRFKSHQTSSTLGILEIIVYKTSSGKVTAVVGSFSYYKHQRTKTLDHWYCTAFNSRQGCKARVFTEINTKNIVRIKNEHNHKPPEFVIHKGLFIRLTSRITLVQNRAGKTLALYGGYTFYLHDVCCATKGWPCTRPRCRARLTTSNDGALLRATVSYVQNKSGKTVALYGGHTFYLHDRHRSTKGWPCTRPRCRARLTTTTDGVLLRATGHHDHEPPRYVIHKGIFTKV
ncbi:FLYWCH zinc finger domain-containing protein [Phthorimaea operculella]|nr:FLYWCH zinc finger domain-containing protein [Phthorimaea operculella]